MVMIEGEAVLVEDDCRRWDGGGRCCGLARIPNGHHLLNESTRLAASWWSPPSGQDCHYPISICSLTPRQISPQDRTPY